MGDFFSEDDNSAQEAQFREDVQAEIFDGKAPVQYEEDSLAAADTDENDQEEENTDGENTNEGNVDSDDDSGDPSEGDPSEAGAEIPSELAKVSKSLNMLTANVNGFENRLKQAERRIGGLNNKFSEAKQVSKTAQKSPTDDQIDKAAKSDRGWDDLTENFPDWAKAFENRIAQSREDLVSKDDLTSIRKELAQIPKEAGNLERRLVGVAHPNWQDVVKSTEYRDWLENQDSGTITKAYHGTSAEEAIDVLNKYKSFKSGQNASPEKSSSSSNKRKKNRLESSVVPNKRTNSKKAKAEDEMSEKEYRAKVTAELFNDS